MQTKSATGILSLITIIEGRKDKYMNTGFINVIVDEWCEMTNIVLDLKELSFSKIQNLLKGTYEILTEYHKDKLIPKEISKLLSATIVKLQNK